MQLAYRHDEQPGESYEALDGKKEQTRNKTGKQQQTRKNKQNIACDRPYITKVGVARAAKQHGKFSTASES